MILFKRYKLEKDMCDELASYARNDKWIVYPEQGGWDLLLVRNSIQVGIQAKLRPNIKLLSQSIVPEEYDGPHYRAIAVGNLTQAERIDITKITKELRLVFIDMSIHPTYWLYNSLSVAPIRHYRHFPKKPLWIPPFVPDLPAGVPSPKNVSPWKVSAVKLEIIAMNKGWVSIIDARDVVNQEVPEKSQGSYPRTLLKTYFTCTNERDPRKPRCKKWVLKHRSRPSKLCPEVFDVLSRRTND